MHSVAQQLGQLGLVELQAQWRMQFGRPASANLSRRLLLRLFIYRLQAEKYGDLSPATSRLLSAMDFSHGIGLVDLNKPGPAGLKPGTVLVRETGGMNHHVMVTKDGFNWNGANFKSLSQVAMAITGTRWNGPRFFGLREVR